MDARILIALEDDYRAYREVLAAGVAALRPGVEVETAVPSDVEEKRADFNPQVIIASEGDPEASSDVTTWIILPTDPSRPTKIYLGGRRFEQSNPTLLDLLDLVDETACLVNDGDGAGS